MSEQNLEVNIARARTDWINGLGRAPFVRSHFVTVPIPAEETQPDGRVTRTVGGKVELFKRFGDLTPEESDTLRHCMRVPEVPGFERVGVHLDVSEDELTVDYRVEDVKVCYEVPMAQAG
jgi:hypothetical protein